MNPTKIVFLINDNVTAFTAVYDPHATNETPRTFKTMLTDLKEGDLVLVQSEARHGYSVVSVVKPKVEPDLKSPNDIYWAIEKVDDESFRKLLEMEEEAITQVREVERNREKAKLREAMFGGNEKELENLKLVNHKSDE